MQSSSPRITSSHSSPTNKLHSSSLRVIHKLHGLPLHQSSHRLIPLPPTSSAVHLFGSFTTSIVFLFNHHIISFVSHQQAPQFIPSNHLQPPRATQSSSSIITLSDSSPTNKLRSSSLQVIHKVRSLPLPDHIISFFSHQQALQFIPSSHSQGTQSSDSIIHPFKSFTRYTVILLTDHIVSIIKKVVGIAIILCFIN